MEKVKKPFNEENLIGAIENIKNASKALGIKLSTKNDKNEVLLPTDCWIFKRYSEEDQRANKDKA